jgi:hypothetical protein
VQINARWDGNDDMDLSLVSATGQRYAWWGNQSRKLSVLNPTGVGQESIGIRALPPGTYALELVRARNSANPIHGTVEISAAGVRRSLSFHGDGTRVPMAVIRIRLEERLVPVGGFPRRPRME